MPAIETAAMPKGRGHGPLLRPCRHNKTGKGLSHKAHAGMTTCIIYNFNMLHNSDN
jgi:hypothetical protein